MTLWTDLNSFRLLFLPKCQRSKDDQLTTAHDDRSGQCPIRSLPLIGIHVDISTELKCLRYCHFYFNRRKYWKGAVLSLPCSLCVALNACFKLRDCAVCITRKGTTGLNYKREMHSGAAPLRECQLFKVLPRQGQGQNNSFYLSATKIYSTAFRYIFATM